MRKLLLAFALGGFLCKSIVDSSPLGVGGPIKDTFEFTPEKDLKKEEDFDTQSVDKIIAVESSVEKAMKELLDVKTVDTVKPDIWPVIGLITSDYGWRRMGRVKEFHPGIDISVPYSTPVSVASDGRVIYAGWLSGYGKTVIVYHGYGFVTLYAHLSDISVDYGEKVVKGQIIGKVGMTGRTTGPHLHYEVIRYGIRQNPIAYLP